MPESKRYSGPHFVLEPDKAQEMKSICQKDGKSVLDVAAIAFAKVYGGREQLTRAPDGMITPEDNIKEFLSSCGVHETADGAIIAIPETKLDSPPPPGSTRLGDFVWQMYFVAVMDFQGFDVDKLQFEPSPARQKSGSIEDEMRQREAMRYLWESGAIHKTHTEDLVCGLINRLAQLDSPGAVKEIRKVFHSAVAIYRMTALRALARMSIPQARMAVERRASWWSRASKQEKELAACLLLNRGKPICAYCSKAVEPLGVPERVAAELNPRDLAKLKINAESGLRCSDCGSIVCAACAYSKADKHGYTAFQCTQCNKYWDYPAGIFKSHVAEIPQPQGDTEACGAKDEPCSHHFRWLDRPVHRLKCSICDRPVFSDEGREDRGKICQKCGLGVHVKCQAQLP